MQISNNLKTFNLLLNILLAIIELETTANPDAIISLKKDVASYVNDNCGLENIIANVVKLEQENKALKEKIDNNLRTISNE